MSETRIFIGTMDTGVEAGIHSAVFDLDGGTFGAVRHAAPVARVLWLHAEPDRNLLYAAAGVPNDDGEFDGAVIVYRVNPETGELTELDRRLSGGGTPCHLAVHPQGRLLLCANYGGGNIAAIPLAEDGTFDGGAVVHAHEGSGKDEKRQAAPHPHGVYFSPTGEHACAVDLGADRIFAYTVAANGKEVRRAPESDLELHAGAGPRHLHFHPSAPMAYVINELDSTICALTWNRETGAFEIAQTIPTIPTLPSQTEGDNYPATIRFHSSGNRLYGTNRGHDSIVVCDLSPETGLFEFRRWHPTGGAFPWDSLPLPGGRWMLAVNKNSNSVNVLEMDSDGAELTVTGERLDLPDPVSICVFP